MVRFEHRRADHGLEGLHGPIVEVLDETEVEEADLPTGAEDVVPRVRVTVERVEAVQAPEHEPEDRLRRQVLLGLAPGQQLAPARAGREVRGQHPTRRQRRDDGRDVDEGVTVVEVGEGLLVRGLDVIVQLLADAGLDLGHHRAGVESLEELAHERAEQVGVGQVGPDGVGHAGVLDLDRDRAFGVPVPIPPERAVDLADRSRGDGLRIPLEEHVVGCRAEFVVDHPGREVGAHRRRVGQEVAEGQTQRFGQAVVEVARHLPELHQRTLHPAEAGGDVLRGPQLAFAVERLRPLGRRERLAGRRRRVAPPDPCPETGQLGVARPA
jgi:hypothetical protein